MFANTSAHASKQLQHHLGQALTREASSARSLVKLVG